MELSNALQHESNTVNFIREGIKIGLINGLLALIIMFGGYYAGVETFMEVTRIARFTPYMMAIVIIYGFSLRKKNGGFISFKEGLQFAFVSYVIADLMIAGGTYVLYNIIDPALTLDSYNYGIGEIEKDIASMEGEQKKDMEKTLADMKKYKPTTGLRTIVQGFGIELIIDFIKSIIITLIIRKEKPAF